MDNKTTGPRPNAGKGQQKTYTITHPAQGSRDVTQEQWRTEGLARQGWVKPEDMPDDDDGGATPPSTPSGS